MYTIVFSGLSLPLESRDLVSFVTASSAPRTAPDTEVDALEIFVEGGHPERMKQSTLKNSKRANTKASLLMICWFSNTVRFLMWVGENPWAEDEE